ncbi:MAG: 1,4-dihydroxy-2-naphthoate octaprenyltransferase, partial [Cytophagales bacterium]|nr:1,4-dihydroxy-2-naphthoate octaprenyltransferase [Cytophagales bacterium]
NDYGDSIHGADSEQRKGPQRTIQAGLISLQSMRKAMVLFGGLSLSCGVLLLLYALDDYQALLFFLLLGGVSIIAAVTYTAGRKPYGYAGLGDISVLLFFGFTGVLGSLYLFQHELLVVDVLPAVSCGLFAVGVLNVNNIRDIESDKRAGKLSIPVRLGRSKAVVYHWLLLTGGVLAALVYAWLRFEQVVQCFFLISLPLFVINGRAVVRCKSPAELDPYLRQLAFASLLFVLTFGLGLIW